MSDPVARIVTAEIVRGKPMPAARDVLNRRGPKVKYPFDTMQPGDSFKVPDGTTYHQICSAIRVYRFKHDRQFKAIVGVSDGNMWVWCEASGKPEEKAG